MLDIIRIHLVGPHITRVDQIHRDRAIEGTAEAFAARDAGGQVQIEHIHPRREVAASACDLVDRGATDQQIQDFIVATSRVVLLTPEQGGAVDAVPDRRPTRATKGHRRRLRL